MRGRGDPVGTHAIIVAFRYGNGIGVAEIVEVGPIRLWRHESGDRGDHTKTEVTAPIFKGMWPLPGGAIETKITGRNADSVVPTFCPTAMPHISNDRMTVSHTLRILICRKS